MEILNIKDINKLRREIQLIKKNEPNSNGEIAVLSQDDEFNRKALEIKGVNILVLNESQELKDYSKQRNSGLNEVLAKIAAKSNIKIGIDFDKIKLEDRLDKARSLARLKQNIMLCKKAGTRLIFLTKGKEKKSLSSILLSLGASTKQASEAFF